MRTTITLDARAADLVKEEMDRTGESLKAVVNRAILKGIGAEAKPFRTETRDMGAPLVDITHALRLAGELEDAALVAKARLGK
jgi:hypothetical protein